MEFKLANQSIFNRNFELEVRNVVLRPGVYHIAGANGTGKTTFFKFILGTLGDTPKPEPLHYSMGYVPQNFREAMLPWLNAKKNLALFKDKGVDATRLALEFGLREADLSKKVFQLSGGQSQRLVVARELALQPEILVMDEPFSALDKSSCSRVLEAIQNLRSSKNITLISTHIPLEAIHPEVKPTELLAERITDTKAIICSK